MKTFEEQLKKRMAESRKRSSFGKGRKSYLKVSTKFNNNGW